MNLELASDELRAVQAALAETLFGSAPDSRLGERFELVTGLTRDEADTLCLHLRDLINQRIEQWKAQGAKQELPDAKLDLEARQLRGVLAALSHCVKTMAPDFGARMSMRREDAAILHERLLKLLDWKVKRECLSEGVSLPRFHGRLGLGTLCTGGLDIVRHDANMVRPDSKEPHHGRHRHYLHRRR